MAGTSAFLNKPSILNAAMTGNIDGIAIKIQGCLYVGAQVIWTGGTTPIGTARIQVSNDNQVTWTVFGGTVSVTGASGSGTIAAFTDVFNVFEFIRAQYIFTSGSGTLSIYISGKK